MSLVQIYFVMLNIWVQTNPFKMLGVNHPFKILGLCSHVKMLSLVVLGIQSHVKPGEICTQINIFEGLSVYTKP